MEESINSETENQMELLKYVKRIFTNVYNGKHFTIIGIRQVAKQFKCSVKNVYAILAKYQNTGAYVVNGFFKGLRVDSEYLKVQRLADCGVASSEAKCETSSNG